MIVNFTPGHLYNIDLKDSDIKNFDSIERSILTSYLDCTLMASTLYKDGEIIAIGGAYKLSASVCEVFLLPSVLVEKYPVCAYRSIKKVLSEIIHKVEILRTQAIVCGSKERSKRLVERLGFNFEGILHRYMYGMDYEIYSISGV